MSAAGGPHYNISFYDSLGYEEYFDFKNKEYIINNLSIMVIFDDGEVVHLMLNPQKIISNNSFFPRKYPKISNGA